MTNTNLIVTDTTLDNLLIYELSQLPVHTPTLNFALNLLYQTGCRATEAVRLDLWTITNDNLITLKPLKFNNPRNFTLSELPPDFYKWHNDQPEYLLWTSYRRIQYLATSMFGNYEIQVGKKHSLLHLFRHNYIRKLLSQGKAIEDIKKIMGHTKLNTTLEYEHTTIIAKSVIMTKKGEIL